MGVAPNKPTFGPPTEPPGPDRRPSTAPRVPHEPGQGGREGHRAAGAHPAKRHAGVLCLEDHADPFGTKGVDEPVGHLGGEALLDLEAPGEVGDNTGKLGQPEEPVAGR